MTGRRTGVVAGVLAALAVATSACGADLPRTGRLSAEEFRAEAESICADGNAAIDELSRDFGADGQTEAQLDEAAETVPRLMTAELDRLAALEPPADLADEVAAMLAEFRRVVASMREQGPDFFELGRAHFADAYAQAKKIGLDTCAD